MNKIVVIPKEGVTVIHPESGNPIRENQEVNKTPQIIRFLKDGDLIEVKEPNKAKKEALTKEAE